MNLNPPLPLPGEQGLLSPQTRKRSREMADVMQPMVVVERDDKGRAREKRSRSGEMRLLDVPLSDPDLDPSFQPHKRYLSEMMSQGLRLRMSLDGTADLGLDCTPAPAEACPAGKAHIFQPSPSHVPTWTVHSRAAPGSGGGTDATPAAIVCSRSKRPTVEGGRNDGAAYASGAASPTDVRYSLNLRKTALLRSLLLRTDDAMQTTTGSAGPIPAATPFEAAEPVWGPAVGQFADCDPAIPSSPTSSSPNSGQLKGSAEAEGTLHQPVEVSNVEWGMSRGLHPSRSMRSQSSLLDTINSSMEGTDDEDDSDEEELDSRRMSMSVHGYGYVSAGLPTVWSGQASCLASAGAGAGASGGWQLSHQQRNGSGAGGSRAALRVRSSSSVSFACPPPRAPPEALPQSTSPTYLVDDALPVPHVMGMESWPLLIRSGAPPTDSSFPQLIAELAPRVSTTAGPLATQAAAASCGSGGPKDGAGAPAMDALMLLPEPSTCDNDCRVFLSDARLAQLRAHALAEAAKLSGCDSDLRQFRAKVPHLVQAVSSGEGSLPPPGPASSLAPARVRRGFAGPSGSGGCQAIDHRAVVLGQESCGYREGERGMELGD